LNEEENFQNPKNGKVTTNLGQTIYYSQRCCNCFLEWIIVVGVLKEERHSMIGKFRDAFLEIWLLKSEKESAIV
jgi:hypothetical protein